MKRILIKPENENNPAGRMETVLPPENTWDRIIQTAEELKAAIETDSLQHSRILMAVQLDDAGINLEAVRMMSLLRKNHGYGEKDAEDGSRGCMAGSAGGILVDGTSEFFTKALCRDLAFAMNGCGCLLPGKPAVEATGSLKNYMVRARNSGRTLAEEYAVCLQELLDRLWDIELPRGGICLPPDRLRVDMTGSMPADRNHVEMADMMPAERNSVCVDSAGIMPMAAGAENTRHNTGLPAVNVLSGPGRIITSAGISRRKRLLCLHASEYRTSNTLQLWTMVRKTLEPFVDIEEISLRNGEIKDCGGCPFRMCMHFSKQNSCYYGGPIPEKVYPALEACDVLLVLCPNYNDAVSANISAFINRLTALFRRRPFFEKYLYAIVVSGYSGSDIVAGQLLDSLTLNKTFRLPPYFAMMETANDPGSIARVEEIGRKAENFAERILAVLYG